MFIVVAVVVLIVKSYSLTFLPTTTNNPNISQQHYCNLHDRDILRILNVMKKSNR